MTEFNPAASTIGENQLLQTALTCVPWHLPLPDTNKMNKSKKKRRKEGKVRISPREYQDSPGLCVALNYSRRACVSMPGAHHTGAGLRSSKLEV